MKNEFSDFHAAAAEIAAAYCMNHTVRPEKIPELLHVIYRGLLHMDQPPATLHVLPPTPLGGATKNYPRKRGKPAGHSGSGRKPKKK